MTAVTFVVIKAVQMRGVGSLRSLGSLRKGHRSAKFSKFSKFSNFPKKTPTAQDAHRRQPHSRAVVVRQPRTPIIRAPGA